MFSTFKLGQAETIAFQRGAQAMLASHAPTPIAQEAEPTTAGRSCKTAEAVTA
jgi:hypothetical protein